MRQMWAVILTVALASACGEGGSSRSAASSSVAESVEDTVRNVLEQLQAATVKRDSSAIARLLDETYAGIAPLGDTISREAVLADVTDTAAGRYDSLVNTRPAAVQVHGDSANANGQMLVHGVQKRQVFIHRADYSYRLIRRPSGWRVTFEQFRHAQ